MHGSAESSPPVVSNIQHSPRFAHTAHGPPQDSVYTIFKFALGEIESAGVV